MFPRLLQDGAGGQPANNHPLQIFLLNEYAQRPGDLDPGRCEKNDQNRREGKQGHGQDHLDWGFMGFFFSPLAALDAHLIGLDAQHLRQAHAQNLALDHRRHKTGHFRDAQSV